MPPPSPTQLTGCYAATERLANRTWAKCSTENGQEHEYKRQPRYSAKTLLINLEFNRAAYESAILSVRLERSKEKQLLPKRRWKGEKGQGISSSRLNGPSKMKLY